MKDAKKSQRASPNPPARKCHKAGHSGEAENSKKRDLRKYRELLCASLTHRYLKGTRRSPHGFLRVQSLMTLTHSRKRTLSATSTLRTAPHLGHEKTKDNTPNTKTRHDIEGRNGRRKPARGSMEIRRQSKGEKKPRRYQQHERHTQNLVEIQLSVPRRNSCLRGLNVDVHRHQEEQRGAADTIVRSHPLQLVADSVVSRIVADRAERHTRGGHAHRGEDRRSMREGRKRQG